MKRILVVLPLALFSLAAGAQPAAPPLPESVTVTGTGHVTVTPDRFSFTVGVQTSAPTVEEAVNANNSKIAAVIASLKKAGATDQEIRTSGFSIYPQQEYSQNSLPRLLGYQVTNSVTVRKSDVAAAGRLLQVAISNGVNTASGLSFEVSDPSRGRDQGLRTAFEDARAKATVLATAAGRTLGRAITISEGTEAPPPPRPVVRAMAMKAEAVSEVPAEAGSQELTFTVTVVFELR